VIEVGRRRARLAAQEREALAIRMREVARSLAPPRLKSIRKGAAGARRSR
jgi:hypothetical protein